MEKKKQLDEQKELHTAEIKQLKVDNENLILKLNNSFDQQTAQKE